MTKTNIVTYPAVFVANDDDSYTVTFPDVNAATTTGQDLGESLINATTVLGRYLQDHQNSLPDATTMTQLQANVESLQLELSEEVLAEIEAVHQVYTYPAP